jgi:hypothetical protein
MGTGMMSREAPKQERLFRDQRGRAESDHPAGRGEREFRAAVRPSEGGDSVVKLTKS